MENEEEDKEKLKKEESKQNSEKTAGTALKGAATYFGGAAGNKAYNVAQKAGLTKIPEEIVGKAIDKTPGVKQASNLLNKAGAVDVANTAMDVASSGGAGGAEGAAKGLPKEQLVREGLEDKKPTAEEASSSSAGSQHSSTGSGSEGAESSEELEKKNKKRRKLIFKIVFALLPFLILFIVFALILAVFTAPAMGILSYFEGVFDNFAGFSNTEKQEEKYYARLEKAQETAYQKYGVCIDVNLIHATLTAYKLDDIKLDEGEQECEDLESCTEGQELLTAGDYKKMARYVDILASMQIKRKKYSLYDTKHCPEALSSDKDLCTEGKNEAKDVLVTEENMHCLDTSAWDDELSTTPFRDSSTPRLVARNDKESIFNFLTKKANKEKNYEYHLYSPAATYEKQEDGTEIRKCEKVVPNSTNEFAQLDIGDWEKDMENNIYFYNLLDSFIEDYYSDYLNPGKGYAEEGTKRYDQALEIIDKIYDYYTVMGPGRYCTNKDQYICRSDGGSEIFSGDRDSFIKSIAGIVVDDMANTGILASLTIAQAAVESSNGNSLLSREYSNYYGMTVGSCAPPRRSDTTVVSIPPGGEGNLCTGNAYWNGTVVWMCNKSGNDCQWYRVYDSFANSTRDHSRLLSTSRYSCQGITDSASAVSCVATAGYAEAGNYASNLNSVINTYNLTQYDIGAWDGTAPNSEGSPQYELCVGVSNGSGTINSGTFISGVCNGSNNVNDINGYWSKHNVFARPQCTWYAYGRSLEILTSAGMSLSDAKKNLNPIRGDAGRWYNQNTNFSSSMNVNTPKVGAIIVWQQPGYWGHVAIIERINRDESGNIQSLVISEGNVKLDKSTTAHCFTRTVDMAYVQRHSHKDRGVDYIFKGYIYLLS